MKRFLLGAPGVLLALGLLFNMPPPVAAQTKAPPGGGYEKVSTLVALPDFLPGLGTLYADPATLPAGPFLAYDRQGSLVSAIYMIPLKDMNSHKAFADRPRQTGGSRRRGVQCRTPRGGRAALPLHPVVRLTRQGSGPQVAA